MTETVVCQGWILVNRKWGWEAEDAEMPGVCLMRLGGGAWVWLKRKAAEQQRG